MGNGRNIHCEADMTDVITQHIIDVPTRVIITVRNGKELVDVNDFYVTDGEL